MSTAVRQARYSDEEWQVRVDLAACYQLVAHFGMTDLIYTHISARVPGPDHHFLINPYGLMFDEITASSLATISLDGELIEDPTGLGINRAGFTIHSAVHAARPEILCVLHTHTDAGMAVSAKPSGLRMITQHACRFHNRIGYHDYEGIATNLDERQRLVRDLGPHKAMILRNHGLLTCGETIPEAFEVMFGLEKSCRAQIMAEAGGGALIELSEEVAEHTAGQYSHDGKVVGQRGWPAYLRMLERLGSGYAT